MEGAEYAVHMDDSGRIDMANGVYYPKINAPTAPAISQTEAVSIAGSDLGLSNLNAATIRLKLMIYPQNGRFNLIYKVRISSRDLQFDWNYFVDAIDGTVLKKQNNIRYSNPQARVFLTHPGLLNFTTLVSLYRLDGTGRLEGTYADILNAVSSRAFSGSEYFVYDTSNVHFDEPNAYYHVDKFRNDFINSFGFQGLSGANRVTVFVDKQVNNSWYNAASKAIYLGIGNHSYARDDKVMYHEYMHGITSALSSIGTGNNETGAIDEGLSDYFAGAFTNRSKILEWSNPSKMRDMNNPQISSYTDYLSLPVVEAHDGGEFFSAILWDLRHQQPAIAPGDADQITYGAITRITSTPNFIDFREAMIAEDIANYAAEDVSLIENVFSSWGVGDPAPPALSVSISGPAFLGFKEQGTWTANATGGHGGNMYEWYYKLGTGSWSGVVSTDSIYSRTMSTQDIHLKVTVTSSIGEQATTTYDVTYLNGFTAAQDKNKENLVIPDHFVLQPNYPNPFNPTTTIRFGLPERSPVRLVIYNIAGQRVATLVNRKMSAGFHQVQWNGKNRNGQQAASGVYIYRLTAGKQQFVKKMLLVR